MPVLADSSNMRAMPPFPAPETSAPCAECGKPFDLAPTGGRGRPAAYCSDDCRAEHTRRRGREYQAAKRAARKAEAPEGVSLVCEECGKPFSWPARGQRPKRCSKECLRAHERRRQALRRAAQPPKPKAPPKPREAASVPCAECGAPLLTQAGDRRLYCSACRRARRAAQARAFRKAYRATHGADYGHSRYAESRKAHNARRRAIVRGSRRVERFTNAEIYARDGWLCRLCGEPVDPALSWPASGSASLDHKLPLVLGGDHTRANVQLAHLGCNSADGMRHRLAALEAATA